MCDHWLRWEDLSYVGIILCMLSVNWVTNTKAFRLL